MIPYDELALGNHAPTGAHSVHGKRQRRRRDGRDACGRGGSGDAFAFARGRVYALDGPYERGERGRAHRRACPRRAQAACAALPAFTRRGRARDAQPRRKLLRHGQRGDALRPRRHEGAARRRRPGRRSGRYGVGRHVHVPFAQLLRRGAPAHKRACAPRRRRIHRCLLRGAADVPRLAARIRIRYRAVQVLLPRMAAQREGPGRPACPPQSEGARMSYIMPAMILLLLGYALYKRVNLYDAFTRGAQEALPLLVQVLPFMAAMLIAMNLFRSSGALSVLISWIEPLLSRLGLPAELVPLLVLRPFSGGAALALLQDVFNSHGADSFLGLAASLMLGSTETIFYTVALYFGSVGVRKTRATVAVALLSGAVGAAVAILFAQAM